MRRPDRLEEHRDNANRTRLRGKVRMAEIANTAQQEYWNTVAGPRWVGLGGFVERRVQRVNDLLLAGSTVIAGERVLEVGCGTGAFTIPLAGAVGERGEVVGVDLSQPMLAGAREQIAQKGLRNVSLLLADAQVHGFEANHFDLITSRFGVMFFADPAAAFRNLLRATRPTGRLCFACWAPLKDNPHWLIAYEVVLRHLGPPAPTPPQAPGPLAFSEPGYVRSFLETAGYSGVRIDRETPEILGATPEEEAEHACIMGPSARLIDEKKPRESVRAVIKREMAEAFRAHMRDGTMLLSSTIFLVTARRP